MDAKREFSTSRRRRPTAAVSPGRTETPTHPPPRRPTSPPPPPTTGTPGPLAPLQPTPLPPPAAAPAPPKRSSPGRSSGTSGGAVPARWIAATRRAAAARSRRGSAAATAACRRASLPRLLIQAVWAPSSPWPAMAARRGFSDSTVAARASGSGRWTGGGGPAKGESGPAPGGAAVEGAAWPCWGPLRLRRPRRAFR